MINEIFNAIKNSNGNSKGSKPQMNDSQSKDLYSMLTDKEYDSYPYQKKDLNEGMVLVKELKFPTLDFMRVIPNPPY